jgi:UDP-glucose 4-epimerase
VLVLGGTGFLGSAMAAALARAGDRVAVFARRPPPLAIKERLLGCDFIQGDVESGLGLGRALEGADLVVHAIGRSLPAESNADPVADSATSLVSIIRTLEALKLQPETRLFYLSSGGAIYGNAREQPITEATECLPISSYGVMKLAAEKYLAMYEALWGIRSLSLRVANAYGPGQPVRASQGFIAACFDTVRRDGVLPVYGGGENVRDFVYVDDIVRAVVALSRADSAARVVNVGSGSGVSLIDVLGLVEKITERKVRIEHRPRRSVDVQNIVLSTKLLESLVGWSPAPLEEGLRRTWEVVGQDEQTG